MYHSRLNLSGVKSQWQFAREGGSNEPQRESELESLDFIYFRARIIKKDVTPYINRVN